MRYSAIVFMNYNLARPDDLFLAFCNYFSLDRLFACVAQALEIKTVAH